MHHAPTVVAAIAVLSGLAAAQSQSPGRGSAQLLASGTAIVVGRVVEADSDRGVGGAVVTLSGAALGPATSMFDDGVPGGPRRVAADSQGRFVFRSLPPGTYSVGANAAGFVPGDYGAARPIAIRRTLDLSRRLELADRERVTADIGLWRLGGLGGSVFDEGGEPLVGVTVTVLARMTDWGGPVMQVTQTATTDDRGAYHVDVTPGNYVVAVLAATTTVPAAATERFNSARREGGAAFKEFMSGVSAGGGLLPRGLGIRVGQHLVHQLSILNVPAVPPFFTGPDNVLFFFPTTFHPAARSATGATLVAVGSGEERAGIDLHLSPISLRRLAGRVAGPAEVVNGLAIRLIADDPAVTRTSPATAIDTPQALADSSGMFTFYGVPPGSYTLRAERTSSVPGGSNWWAVDPITVGDDDVDDLEVILRTGVTIAGRVVPEGNATAAVPNMRSIAITARPLPGSPASLLAARPVERPDETGAFTTRGLAPGPYVMSVPTLPAGWVLKSIATRGQDAVDRPFELTSSGVDDMVVTITTRISTLAGVVNDDNGRPARAATVAVFPVDKSLWRLPGIASRRVQTAAPGRDGRYTFRGLPAGDYYVVAADWATADFSDGQVLTRLIPSAERVTLADGGAASEDLRVVVIR